jgi:hypothetical protein
MHLAYTVTNHSLEFATRGPDGTEALGTLGGVLTSGPAAITIGSEFANTWVFGRGTNRAVWYRQFSDGRGTWGKWASLGGRALGAATATAVGGSTARPIVFVRGTDGALWQRAMTSGGWKSLGGRLISDPGALPALAGNPPRRVDVFAIGRDFAVWEFTGSWYRVGGRSTVAPSAVQLPAGRTYLFARGTDNALWVTTRAPGAASFGGWQRIGGVLTSPPTATIFPATPATLSVLTTAPQGFWVASRAVSGGSWTWTHIP